ncbi:citrate synthase [Leifsonia sp. Root227]|uniref:citrate synthase n=1 Tax=Leifsonia sp. Root227 TaxID=1736496 RepID=UPI001F1C31FD|nr:citrate synthase [Leifsonia sp. Root227]
MSMDHLCVNVDHVNVEVAVQRVVPEDAPRDAEARALPRLTAEQTAERLGVKIETLYAYVARGRLDRIRTPDGSTFDPLEVERFAGDRRRRPASGPHGHSDGRPLMVVETSFALIEDGELFYRGRNVASLTGEPFETVAHWALTGDWDAGAAFAAGPGLDAARRVGDALPAAATTRDRQQVAVTALAAADPLRYSLDRAAVVGAAEGLVAGMVEALPVRSASDTAARSQPGPPGPPSSLAARLWAALTDAGPTALPALNAALVLLLDHDLAVSTLAARAAASARANPYAVVTAGLGALDSPLHGNASRAAHRMLARVVAGEPAERVVADTVVAGRGPVPGFGHALYPDGDPRARALLGMLGMLGRLGVLREPAAASTAVPFPTASAPHAAAPPTAAALDAAADVAAIVHRRTGLHPNIDLALGALSLAAGMAEDAGEVVFATARSIGWVVHAIDEYEQPPLRLRPVGRYVG